MFYNYYQSDDYNYDSCTAKGICSIDPKISSLQEVIIMYTKQLVFYTLKLKQKGISNKIIKESIINTFSGLTSNTDYSHEQFKNIIMNIHEQLNQSKILYERICKENNSDVEVLKSKLKIKSNIDFNQAIKQGEKEFLRKNKEFSPSKRSLYEIIFVLIKNACINLIELKDFDIENDEVYYGMLHLINMMNSKKVQENKLKKAIEQFVKMNYQLIKQLQDAQNLVYGDSEVTKVSFSTTSGKAILVSGSNLKELEKVLEATIGSDIDVYTHGSMILAHMHPYFKKYPHLKGQFGLGVENCLLDFATFPGAILMTKNSLQNIEYLYRGRLFTTDSIPPKGVTPIIGSDFSQLIKSTKDAKGFKKGQERDSLIIGFNEKNIMNKIDEVIKKVQTKKIEHLIIIGILNHTSLQKRYFERLLKILPKNTHAITLSTYMPSTNVFQLSSRYDFMLISKILEAFQEKIEGKNFDISVFLTKCDKFAIANILNLKALGSKNIFLSYCSPLLINPTIINAFKDTFKIKTIHTPKADLNYILNPAV